MKKFGLIVGAILFIIVLLLVGLRIGLGMIVSSEGFRSFFQQQLEKAVHAVMPTLISEVKGTELVGLGGLAVTDVTIRNSRKIAAALSVPRTVLAPDWSSLLIGDTWHFTVEALVGDDGHLSLRGSVPSWIFSEHSERKVPAGDVRLEGSVNNLNAVALSTLLFPDQATPGFYLSRGLLSGAVQFSKPLGSPAATGKKNGRFSGKLEDATWILAEENNRPLPMSQITLNLELVDDAILIRSPALLHGHTGKANITGGLFVPRQSSDNPAWNLIVNVESDTGLSSSLGKLFKCTTPVTTSHYTVKGPVTATTCTP